MKLVDNWKEAWRWNSTQVLALIAALPVIWMELPPETQALIRSFMPPQVEAWFLTGLAVLGIIARLRDQSK